MRFSTLGGVTGEQHAERNDRSRSLTKCTRDGLGLGYNTFGLKE